MDLPAIFSKRTEAIRTYSKINRIPAKVVAKAWFRTIITSR
jgi:hypothetical protein